MSTREEILGRVRQALGDAPHPTTEVPRGYRGVGDDLDRSAVLARFVERVEDYRATVTRCRAAEVAEVLARAVAGRSVVVPAGLPWPVPGSVDDAGQSAGELDAIDAVVSGAALGIAATGTVVLDHGPGQGRRALTLVPDLHVCVLAAAQVVAGVPQAVARLDPARPQTWISGPSATSDIELDRVEGVHGPRTLHVVLVDDL
ncbi:lactate utilization protein C [Nocardioides sp. NBC_00850]|uniref:LutC/YkgG family protein n=1 Tax=Nocardioides sp. NBC_00850 TaxID=2976001 RepID=UPI003870947F|nr:lactate utilization protein C [Nocardioides sp. NBC_00850]